MNDHLESLVRKYRSAGALIDSNLYLLLLIGTIDIRKVGNHRRVKEYTVDDFGRLNVLVSRFERFFTTPNVMTEVSNLAGSGDAELVPGIHALLGRHIADLDERYISTRDAFHDPLAPKLGIADVTLKILSSRGHLLITSDFALANYVARLKYDVLNFNHLRFLDIQSPSG